MKHSVKLILEDNNFYCIYKDNGLELLDLCAKHINRLWTVTRGVKEIVVTVSEKKHKGSKFIRVDVGEYGILCWSSRGKREAIDCLAGQWILKHFPNFKDGEVHLVHVSAKPL